MARRIGSKKPRTRKPRASASKYVVWTFKPRRSRPTERYFRLRTSAQKAVRRAKARGFDSRLEPITGSWGGGYIRPRKRRSKKSVRTNGWRRRQAATTKRRSRRSRARRSR